MRVCGFGAIAGQLAGRATVFARLFEAPCHFARARGVAVPMLGTLVPPDRVARGQPDPG